MNTAIYKKRKETRKIFYTRGTNEKRRFCEACNGLGWFQNKLCRICRGSGRKKIQR